MDDVVKTLRDHRLSHQPAAQTTTPQPNSRKPTREEAEAAVRTLIGYIGDDPDREGLLDTPRRVVAAYDEFFGGYAGDPAQVLVRVFEDVSGYDDLVVVRDIPFVSHC